MRAFFLSFLGSGTKQTEYKVGEYNILRRLARETIEAAPRGRLNKYNREAQLFVLRRDVGCLSIVVCEINADSKNYFKLEKALEKS